MNRQTLCKYANAYGIKRVTHLTLLMSFIVYLTFTSRTIKSFTCLKGFIMEARTFCFEIMTSPTDVESSNIKTRVYIGLTEDIPTLCNTPHYHVCIFIEPGIAIHNKYEHSFNGWSFKVLFCKLLNEAMPTALA